MLPIIRIWKPLVGGLGVIVLAVLAGFAGGRSCSPVQLPPDKPLPAATVDAGVQDRALDAETERRLAEIEARLASVEEAQRQRRAAFSTSQREELARVRDGGRGSVATWLDDFARHSSESSPSRSR